MSSLAKGCFNGWRIIASIKATLLGFVLLFGLATHSPKDEDISIFGYGFVVLITLFCFAFVGFNLYAYFKNNDVKIEKNFEELDNLILEEDEDN